MPERPRATAGETETNRQPQRLKADSKDPRTATGILVIDSTPRGASIFIDNEPLGITPTTILKVPAGQHAIVLRRKGYVLHTQWVFINAQQILDITPSLTRLMGEL